MLNAVTLEIDDNVRSLSFAVAQSFWGALYYLNTSKLDGENSIDKHLKFQLILQWCKS